MVWAKGTPQGLVPKYTGLFDDDQKVLPRRTYLLLPLLRSTLFISQTIVPCPAQTLFKKFMGGCVDQTYRWAELGQSYTIYSVFTKSCVFT